MEVILKEEIQGLGKALEVVKVKNGFAHNFLFPRNKAVLATSTSKKTLEVERVRAAKRYAGELAAIGVLAEKMKDISLTIAAKVHEGEKLYGSIQASDISAKLKEIGYDVDKRAVLLAEPIKQLGMYTLKIQLHKEIETKVKLWVINDESK